MVAHRDPDKLELAEQLQRYAPREGETAVPVIGMRRQIAQHMQAALAIPHFTYVEEVDVTELEVLRSKLNERFVATRRRLQLHAAHDRQ